MNGRLYGANKGKRNEQLDEPYGYCRKNADQKAIAFGVGMVDEKTIDEINILQATFLAMKKAVENLKVKPDFLLIDGKWTLEDYPVSQTAIPKGDQNIFSIAENEEEYFSEYFCHIKKQILILLKDF